MQVPIIEVSQPGRRALRVAVPDELEIGRECDGLLIVDDEASRRHLRLRAQGDRLWATDLGSTNGTTLNGAPLTGEIEIREGDVLMIGVTRVQRWRPGDRPPPPPGGDRDTVIRAKSAPPPPADRTPPPMPSSPPMPAPAPYAGDPVTSIELVAAQVDGRSSELIDLSSDGDTVTVVFSDIESSTEQALRLGDERWFEVLSGHNDLVRSQLRRFGGSEIKAQGDGFMLTFPSARRAVRFAMAVQTDLEDGDLGGDDGIRIRIGLHTGEAIVDDVGDLFGKHIIVAARVANEAQGGEILVSSVVREIVSSRGDIDFGPERSVALKGISDDYVVHPVTWR